MRYFIQLSYKGTNYHGWQIQPNATSVQETLQKAFSTVLRENIAFTGAGRTDTGVHAINFFAHFDYNDEIEDVDRLMFKINSFLPYDISISKIFNVSDDVHARFSALSRTYEYRTHSIKDPFLHEFSYKLNFPVDFNLMNEAADSLFKFSDFTSFSKLHTDTITNNCKIYKAEWHEKGSQNIFIIKADRFLRNMVRAITGTLLDVGKGKISISDFIKIIESKDRQNAGVSVPAKGLYLTEIQYPEGIIHS